MSATSTADQSTRLSPCDAEILIYLLPQAQELRRQGMGIGWERQESPKLNQEVFYVFWVVNNKRSDVEGSNRVGFFAVNKYTAEVWDDDSETLIVAPGTDFEGVQIILRNAHHIDAKMISAFRDARPWKMANQ